MQMQKYVIWLVSAVLGIGAYFLGELAGVASFISIILLAVGAIGGAFLGAVLTTPKRS